MDGVDKSITGRGVTPTRTEAVNSQLTRPADPATQRTPQAGGSLSRISDPPRSVHRGADIARAALDAARAAARSNARSASGRRSGVQAPGSRRRRGWSGPRPDDRDPQAFGRLAARLVADRGWAERVSGGLVFGRWARLVGDEVAEHARPVSLREGELTVQASSTAWATQLRLLQRQLIVRITVGVGPGVVTRLRVQGPATPTWVHGPRHIRGRGPRDTYG
ncbi:MAG: DciA family protein [Pseudonocardiaceae bacterium]